MDTQDRRNTRRTCCLSRSIGNRNRRDVAFPAFKKNKRWIIKALDRNTGRTVAWVVGARDAATVRRLYCQLDHLNDCLYLYRRLGCFRQSLAVRETPHRKKIYHSHRARQLKYPSSSGENDPKNEDCQPVRGDDQPFHEVMACVDYSSDLH